MNSRVIGAVVLGVALVGGAYVLSGFSGPQPIDQIATVRQAPEAPPRVPITVVDNDQDGVEDWRDAFITTDPIVLSEAEAIPYEPPDTLTGELGINFFQNIIRGRGYGAFGQSDEEVIQNTVETLTQITETKIYDTPDITIMSEWDEQDIVTYANAMALSVMRNDLPDLEGELFILEDILNSGDAARISELLALAEGYRRNRDDALAIPVPAFLVKEHLDLINTYSAIYEDILAMTLVLDDPAKTLLRLKRYEDDATGLGLALQNMIVALAPHASSFSTTDPAALLIIFDPNYQGAF